MTALYDVEVVHHRPAPVAHHVRHRSYLWFVDVDSLDVMPRGLRWLARFDSADHLGDPARSIKQNVSDFLATQGITDITRITMLANARSLGYVFNPLTLFWCHGGNGADVVIAEVHNTYGQSHCYLLLPDDSGRTDTRKRLYVSPFFPVDGYYRMSLPEPGGRLSVTVTLHRTGDRPFVATVRGTRRPAGPAGVVRAALRYPLSTWRVRAAIIRHGVILRLKGLPIIPRPDRV